MIVVEGTLDAMAIAVAAIRSGTADYFCPVTQSGRELSPGQLEAVLRLHPGPTVVSFDGDPAGQDSNRRLLRAVLGRGRAAVLVDLPNDEDPASWLADRGPAGLPAWLGHSRTGQDGRLVLHSPIRPVTNPGAAPVTPDTPDLEVQL